METPVFWHLNLENTTPNFETKPSLLDLVTQTTGKKMLRQTATRTLRDVEPKHAYFHQLCSNTHKTKPNQTFASSFPCG